ncbi:MAG: hypothetical protein WKF63_05525 [Thermomicrobiales bacterium]
MMACPRLWLETTGFLFTLAVNPSRHCGIRSGPSTASSALVGDVQTGHRGRLTQRTFVEADGHRWAEVTFESARELHGYVSMKCNSIT